MPNIQWCNFYSEFQGCDIPWTYYYSTGNIGPWTLFAFLLLWVLVGLLSVKIKGAKHDTVYITKATRSIILLWKTVLPGCSLFAQKLTIIHETSDGPSNTPYNIIISVDDRKTRSYCLQPCFLTLWKIKSHHWTELHCDAENQCKETRCHHVFTPIMYSSTKYHQSDCTLDVSKRLLEVLDIASTTYILVLYKPVTDPSNISDSIVSTSSNSLFAQLVLYLMPDIMWGLPPSGCSM